MVDRRIGYFPFHKVKYEYLGIYAYKLWSHMNIFKLKHIWNNMRNTIQPSFFLC